ncbi:hypothetical protein SDC9_200415 [bioreactor metagenome]|uniref:Uncharacterized protein n=1 Tax=bioreactor metagenome TaxID=1076179 RepID=A0A645IZX2_9ZZZZ
MVFLCAGFARWVKGHQCVAGKVRVAGEVVGQHQGFASSIMFEPEQDAFVFQLAADEVEVGVAVLGEVLPGLVLELETLVVADAVLYEYLANDVGDGLVLPDAKVGAARGVPQAWGESGFVHPVAPVTAGGREVDHLA